MKNLFKSMMLVAVAAMGFTACSKDAVEEVNPTIENKTYTMTFVADAPDTRTSVSINGNTANFAWSAGDKVSFIQSAVGANKTNKKNSGEAAFEGQQASFTTEFEVVDGATAYNYGAYYPTQEPNQDKTFNNVVISLAASQNLTNGTFDPAADLLMSKPILNVTELNGHGGLLQFTRIAAVGKMNLKLDGMVAGEVIESVTFALSEGTHFNGPVTLDLENSTYNLGTTNTSNKVTLTGELAANADRTAIFFTCFPGVYNGAYTIEVETNKANYSKGGDLPKALSFTAGDVLNFNATVENRIEKVIEAGTTVDVLNRELTGVAANSTAYTSWTGKKSNSSAVYAGNSAGGNNSIQLRVPTKDSHADSGIITTTSGGKATKIEVTWNTNTANGRTLNIYGKNTAYTSVSDLYTATQGTLLGTIVYGTSTVLEIDGDYEYIGMRSNSNAMYLSEIEITWTTGEGGGEDPVDPTPDPGTGDEPGEGGEEPEPSGNVYTKVTEAPADWSGTYLIVWDNGAHGTIDDKDLAKTVDVTITNSQIASTTEVDNAAVTITKTATAYSMTLPSGKYLSLAANNNQVAERTDVFDLNFQYTNEGVEISGTDNAGNTRYVLKNGQYYRAYKAIGSYVRPTLYKKN